jgi:acetyl esterase
VAFDNFRTQGAFLVSAKRTAGVTQFVTIRSEIGSSCVVNPDIPNPKITINGEHATPDQISISGDGFYIVCIGAGDEVTFSLLGIQNTDLNIQPLPADKKTDCLFGFNETTVRLPGHDFYDTGEIMMLKRFLDVMLVMMLVAVVTVCAMDQPHTYTGKDPDTMWTYKPLEGKALQLHVFLPPDYDADKRFPAIVVFHGGSWNAGEPAWHYPDCVYWSGRGMIAAAVSYRLRTRDKVQVPLECVKDAKSAIRFLRKNAERLKVDPERIVAAGGSAGGQLAAATAMITAPEVNDNAYDLSISCVPNAVVGYNPWFRCEPELNPQDNVRPGLPPTIVFLGSKDPLPVPEMRGFHGKMIAAGNDSEFYVGVGAGHGFCNGRNPVNPYFYWSLELVDRFLVKHGLLSGKHNIQRPEGLPAVESEAYLSKQSVPH